MAMPEIIEKCMRTVSFIREPVYDDYVYTHRETQSKALEYIQSIN
jgi:hypothetical protein